MVGSVGESVSPDDLMSAEALCGVVYEVVLAQSIHVQLFTTALKY